MQPDPQARHSGAPSGPVPETRTDSSTLWKNLPGIQSCSKKPEDFTLGTVLGEGSFAKVFLAREVATSKEFAIKVLEKKKVTKVKHIGYVAKEVDILARLDHPFFVKLYFAFQDEEKVYFVLNYARNGDLRDFVEERSPLGEACARFYSAEIVSALEYLHGLDIVHRDLKPENILLDGDMHILITDFGLAKRLHPKDKQNRATSFVGTPHFVSPEILLGKGVCKSSDLWALGCVICELVTGLSPFEAEDRNSIFQKILELKYHFPDQFNPKAKDLVEKLLVLDCTKRLGCEEMGSYGALKEHPFFETITWDNLHLQTPPQVTGSLVFTSEDHNDFINIDIRQSQIPPLSSHSLAKTEPNSFQSCTGLLASCNNWIKSLWKRTQSFLKRRKGLVGIPVICQKSLKTENGLN